VLTPAEVLIEDPQFAERWFAGTYVVTGVFLLDGSGLTSAKITADIEPLYLEIRKQKKAKWPRGLAGFFVIQIYCAPSFGEEVLASVRRRLPFQWAIWPEPLLYRTSDNSVSLREDFGLHGRAYYPYLNQLFVAGLIKAAAHFGHRTVPPRKEVPNQSLQPTPPSRRG
jgi:hypothetical protein